MRTKPSASLRSGACLSRIPVTLFIGEKNFVETGDDKTKTGYKRHYEGPFFKRLEDKVNFEIRYLYPLKGRKYSIWRHLLNHFYHPFYFKEDFKKDRVKHIMFGEEAFMLNYLPGKKTVVSCLDVIPLAMKGETSAKFRWFAKWAYKGMNKAEKIIANSEYTKKDIMKYLKIDEKKIAVAYPPIQAQFKIEEEAPDSFYHNRGLSADRKYLLYVGALDLKRKNVSKLLQAFKLFRGKHMDTHLLLVGYTTLKGGIDSLSRKITKMGLGGSVHIIRNVPDEELVAFYNMAHIFVFPSLYEGFGLPPLEAMACGTPVVSSDRASLPEALGDAAVYANPTSPTSIADAIEQLHSDEALYDKLVARGLKQAEKYSWQKYADDTLKVYEEVF
ncbi:glycosyltransferase family 4 protein [Patescibacteria group bacterium]